MLLPASHGSGALCASYLQALLCTVGAWCCAIALAADFGGFLDWSRADLWIFKFGSRNGSRFIERSIPVLSGPCWAVAVGGAPAPCSRAHV